MATVPRRRRDGTPTTTERWAGALTTVFVPAVTATRNGPLYPVATLVITNRDSVALVVL
jgi:hypothetical protein